LSEVWKVGNIDLSMESEQTVGVRQFFGMDRLGERLMEFSSSLGNSFFMVFLSVSLVDLAEQSLFHTFEGNSC
jgi:hypothetical protein